MLIQAARCLFCISALNADSFAGFPLLLLTRNCCDIPAKKNKKLREMMDNLDKNDFYKHVCGNPFGIYTVDEDEIKLHYDRILNV